VDATYLETSLPPPPSHQKEKEKYIKLSPLRKKFLDNKFPILSNYFSIFFFYSLINMSESVIFVVFCAVKG
jgi:hypothetical protein